MKDRRLILVTPDRIMQVMREQELYSPLREDTERADKVFWQSMSQVGAYYDAVFAAQDCPTQDAFWQTYIRGNDAEAERSPEDVVMAMRWRLFRAYNTFVIEHQLMAYLAQSGRLAAVWKSELLDIKTKVDVAVKLLDGQEIGIDMRMPTLHAAKWVDIKRHRARDHLWTRGIVEVTPRFDAMLAIPAQRTDGSPCKLHMWTEKTVQMVIAELYGEDQPTPDPAPAPSPKPHSAPPQPRLFDVQAKRYW